MIIAFTGNRPSKLGGYKLPNPTYTHICTRTHELLLELKPERCISGLAQGFDQYAAFVCLKLGIPLTCAIPHVGQESIWPAESQAVYHKLLNRADEVVIVSNGGYSAEKMLIRNRWMIDHCDEALACFDGTVGGTKYTVDYAKSQKKPVHIIDPKEAT